MNIVINAILFHDKPRGVGTYLNNLLYNLAEIDRENNYYIYYGSWMENYSFLQIKNENFKFIKSNTARNKVLRNIYQLIIFPIVCLRYKPDIIHIPDTSPLLYKFRPTVSTIHDISEYIYPEKYSKIQSVFRKVIVKFQMKISDEIFTVSKFSKDNMIEIFNLYDEKIKVIPNGIDFSKFKSTLTNTYISKCGLLEDQYFLYVGEIEKTKNVGNALVAFSEFIKEHKNYKFVICGKNGNDTNNIKSIIEDKNLNDNVIMTGYVSNHELIELYTNSFAFVFPSLFEGFGLPILEAMAVGTPVLCSNTSSLPEVSGDCAILFDPLNSSEIFNSMNKLYNNKDIRKEIIKKGMKNCEKYSWRDCALATLNEYKMRAIKK